VIDQILDLMTPEDILAKTEFDKAFPILPERFPTFDHLLEYKREVRDLILLPVKSDEMRAHYNSLDKAVLLKDLAEKMGDCHLYFDANEYPYLVPEGTDQQILWIRDPSASRQMIATYLAFLVKMGDLPSKLDEVILFERPMRTETKLVKGTFPAMRHLHVWTRKS